MPRPLRSAGLLATLALLSAGCGHQSKPEMPEPVTQESSPVASPSPAANVPEEKIPENVLTDAQRDILEERISFDFDRFDLSPAAREKLSAKAEILRSRSNLSLRVEGHADERGSDEYNLALSNRRAAAAMRFLVSQGITQDRFETVGFGEERPLDSGENEAAWAKNRRDEFRVSSGPLAQR
jgi:peptidoglycan-associated lipoprotein